MPVEQSGNLVAEIVGRLMGHRFGGEFPRREGDGGDEAEEEKRKKGRVLGGGLFGFHDRSLSFPVPASGPLMK